MCKYLYRAHPARRCQLLLVVNDLEIRNLIGGLLRCPKFHVKVAPWVEVCGPPMPFVSRGLWSISRGVLRSCVATSTRASAIFIVCYGLTIELLSIKVAFSMLLGALWFVGLPSCRQCPSIAFVNDRKKSFSVFRRDGWRRLRRRLPYLEVPEHGTFLDSFSFDRAQKRSLGFMCSVESIEIVVSFSSDNLMVLSLKVKFYLDVGFASFFF